MGAPGGVDGGAVPVGGGARALGWVGSMEVPLGGCAVG